MAEKTEKKMAYPEGKYMGSVKVGPKGQIVIPKEARALFNIQPGDTLLLLADKDRGIAIHEYDVMINLMNQAFEPPVK